MGELTIVHDGIAEVIEVQPTTAHEPSEYVGISETSASIAASAGCPPDCAFLQSCWLLHWRSR